MTFVPIKTFGAAAKHLSPAFSNLEGRGFAIVLAVAVLSISTVNVAHAQVQASRQSRVSTIELKSKLLERSVKFAVKYAHKFIFAASLSGALDAAVWRQTDLPRFESVWQSLASVFESETNATRYGNDLTKLFSDLPADAVAQLPYVYLDCGTEDPLWQTNRRFAELLVKKKVRHEFRQLLGAHAWSYWDQHVLERCCGLRRRR